MDITLRVLQQVAIMLLPLGLGVLLYRIKLITDEGNRQLSSLLLFVVNPALIFITYDQAYDAKHLQGLLLSCILTAAGIFVMIVLSHFLVKDKHKEYQVERFAATYSNCGFIGIPIVNGVFGSEGVFYLTGVITVFNIFVWTHGILLMKGREGEKLTLKETAKNLFTPALVAALLGLIFYLLQIPVPELINESIGYVADMNTPLAMLIAGLTLAQSDLKRVLFNKRLYYISFLKLLLYPIILIVLFYWLPIDSVVLLSIVISLGGPVAAACTAMALRFNKSPVYASELFAMTTLFSAVTLPLVVMFHTLMDFLF
ncbi:putative transporter YfdV [uncultured Ruminococcus sp.]|nr:putative transporter YfdV [uncultured Clostridium sp.]SCI26341.1 putative transporter YfdV [uncultured Ruminococcus sp.]